MASSGGQDRPAGNGHGAVGIQGLVVRAVSGPDRHGAPGNGQVPIGVKAVAGAAVGGHGAAGNVDGKVIVCQIPIGGIDAVVCGADVEGTGAQVDGGPFQRLVGGGDGHGGALGVFGADGQSVVTVEGIVTGGEGQIAAFDIQGGFRVDAVVVGGLDVQRQLPDGETGLPLGLGGGTGLDAVFPLGQDVQGAAALKRHLGAVLAFDHGVFGAGIAGVIAVVFRVLQGVLRAVRCYNGHLGALAADNGGGGFGGQLQPTEHQGHAGGALPDLDAAVGTLAGEQIGPGLINGQGRAVDFQTGEIRGGDGGIRKGDGGGLTGCDGAAGFLEGGFCRSAAGDRRGAAGEQP